MNWKTYIYTNPDILVGKPIIKGTRLSVDFILDLYANGWSETQILENYPAIKLDALRAVFAYAAESMREENIYFI